MERSVGLFTRHPDDRRIFALAVPALGALAADPLYSLADTAFVGNLGTPQLGALAIGSAAFTASFWLFSFLAYGVTPRVARALGAGDEAEAARVGVSALVLAVLIGMVVTALGVLFAGPIVSLLGAHGDVAEYAEPYLRIRILAATPVLIGQVGHGWLRGAQDTRTPMVVAVTGTLIHIVLEYFLIYPAGMGVDGAAWATLVGQGLAASAFVVILLRRMHSPVLRWDRATIRSLLRIGIDLAVRTGALLAGLTVATSIAARMGRVVLGGWQIAMQLFLLLALTLDSIAIAGQALVGRRLGQADRAGAFDVSRRLMELGLVLGVLLGAALLFVGAPLASVFTDDPRVASLAADLLLWLALIQPLSAVAFTLDGILIGAADTRFLAVSMGGASAIFIALALVALHAGWGPAGLVGAATVWLLVRAATTGARWSRRGWIN